MEDITVEHRHDAETAYFDMKNRILCLPVWEDMDSSLYDMLVGHEVSHALNTPIDGWVDWVGEGEDAQIRQMFVNVVEDARIERMIKNQFPGLRRDFAKGYKGLFDRDVFQLKDKDLKSLGLIDRLNLHFKIGILGIEEISFSDDEKIWVDRMESTNTFDEVLELAQDLFGDWEKNKEQNQPETVPVESAPAPGDGDGTTECTDGDSQNDRDGDGVGSSSVGDVPVDGDAGETPDAGATTPDLSYESYSNDSVGSTQHAFDSAIRGMRNNEADCQKYHTLPRMVLDEIIVPWQNVEDHFNAHRDSKIKQWMRDEITEIENRLQTFLKSSKPIVNHMVQQFQMKQAADADKRSNVAKTGILDTLTMINYRWSEDIFLKNEVHSDGKNHGIVMFLDWSASMNCILKDTLDQLIILVEFCRKAGIPYEVYAFSSGLPMLKSDQDDYWKKGSGSEQLKHEQFIRTKDSDMSPHQFSLINFLSCEMNREHHNRALKNLYSLTGSWGTKPEGYDLGCTPLNEATVAAIVLVPEFQSKHNVQIVNAIFLTDGDGHSMGAYVRGYGSAAGAGTFVRDEETKKTYKVGNNETDTYTEILKDRTGATVIGIRLHGRANLRGLGGWGCRLWQNDEKGFLKACDMYKKQKYCTYNNAYDEQFLVQGNISVTFDALDDLAEDASYTRIKNAFIKGSTGKKNSRVLANRIIDLVS